MEQGVRERVGASLRAFERAWLDPLDVPIARAIRELGWAPDGAEAYCDRCGATVGPAEAVEFGCSRCVNTRPAWARFVRLGAYESPLREWVQELKFERRRPVGRVLGRALGVAAREAGVLEGVRKGRVAVVPVPMPRVRFLTRGIDHTGAIGSSAAAELGVGVVRAVRASMHPSQRTVASSGRRANVRGKYRVSGRTLAGVGRAVVVDDVVTTGATVTEVCRTIRKACPGVELWVASVCVVS
ncbi:MAG: hypothetical protein RLN60_03220 [Phycisphaerales bacterium]